MTPEQYEQHLTEFLQQHAGKVQPPVPIEKDLDSIEKHIERIRAYALEHPCVLDDDFARVFAEGRNRALFNYNRSWLVSIMVSVSADENFKQLFWQVSTSLISAYTGKPRRIALLAGKEQRQLQRSRNIVMKDVSQKAAVAFDVFVEKFHQQNAYHACCDLTDEESKIAASFMSIEQLAVMGKVV